MVRTALALSFTALALIGCQRDTTEPVTKVPPPPPGPVPEVVADTLYYGGPIVTVDDTLPSLSLIHI